MKKVVLLLVVLLVPVLLTACSSESQDTAKDYMNAVLKGDIEDAQGFACDEFKEETAALATGLALAEDEAVRNIDLKYDLGKGNNAEEVIVTGSYDIVTMRNGKVVADSEEEYELASATRDKRDLNNDGDDRQKIDTRVLVEMKEQDGDWCVLSADGGYWNPKFEGEEDAVEDDAADDSDAMDDTAEDAAVDTADDATDETADDADAASDASSD